MDGEWDEWGEWMCGPKTWEGVGPGPGQAPLTPSSFLLHLAALLGLSHYTPLSSHVGPFILSPWPPCWDACANPSPSSHHGFLMPTPPQVIF